MSLAGDTPVQALSPAGSAVWVSVAAITNHCKLLA